MTTIGYLGK